MADLWGGFFVSDCGFPSLQSLSPVIWETSCNYLQFLMISVKIALKQRNDREEYRLHTKNPLEILAGFSEV